MKDRAISNPASEFKQLKRTLPSADGPAIQIGNLESGSSARAESDYMSSSLRNTKHLQKLVQEY